MKPLTYLTALQSGLQPNTLVSDDPITLAPIGAQTGIIAREYNSALREEYFSSPRNTSRRHGRHVHHAARAGEFSRRRDHAPVEGGISADPEKVLISLATAVATKIYAECVRSYPFGWGAQPVHMVDLTAFYAAMANKGALPKPHAIEWIESDGHTVSQYPARRFFY